MALRLRQKQRVLFFELYRTQRSFRCSYARARARTRRVRSLALFEIEIVYSSARRKVLSSYTAVDMIAGMFADKTTIQYPPRVGTLRLACETQDNCRRCDDSSRSNSPEEGTVARANGPADRPKAKGILISTTLVSLSRIEFCLTVVATHRYPSDNKRSHRLPVRQSSSESRVGKWRQLLKSLSQDEMRTDTDDCPPSRVSRARARIRLNFAENVR